MDDFFQSKHRDYKATSRSVSAEDKEAFSRELARRNVDCPFRWLLSPELEKPIDPIAPPLIEDLLPHFANSKNDFLARAQVSTEQQIWVAEKTKEQRNSSYWGLLPPIEINGK